MNELPKHLKYNPCPEIVRAHEQWQAQLRQTMSQLQSMGNVRAPEAIANICMPLFAHVDALFTLLQADQAAYSEQIMAMLQEVGGGEQEVIIGLHPQDAEALADLTDHIHAVVEKVAKGLKDGSGPRKQLEEALKMLGDLQEAVMSAALEEDEVPPNDGGDDSDDAVELGRSAEAGANDLSDEPLQITG